MLADCTLRVAELQPPQPIPLPQERLLRTGAVATPQRVEGNEGDSVGEPPRGATGTVAVPNDLDCDRLGRFFGLQETFEVLNARRMAQLTQRFGLDLADAL